MADCSIIRGTEIRGKEGEREKSIQIYSTDIDAEIGFVSADANGKHKASLSLLVNLCLVVTWIVSKKINTANSSVL